MSEELVRIVEATDISVDVGDFVTDSGGSQKQVGLRIKNDTGVDVVAIIDPKSPLATALFNTDLGKELQNAVLTALTD